MAVDVLHPTTSDFIYSVLEALDIARAAVRDAVIRKTSAGQPVI